MSEREGTSDYDRILEDMRALEKRRMELEQEYKKHRTVATRMRLYAMTQCINDLHFAAKEAEVKEKYQYVPRKYKRKNKRH